MVGRLAEGRFILRLMALGVRMGWVLGGFFFFEEWVLATMISAVLLKAEAFLFLIAFLV